MERRSSPMSGQRASQTQFLNTVIGLNAAQREPLSVVSELQGHGLVIGLFHLASGWYRQNACSYMWLSKRVVSRPLFFRRQDSGPLNCYLSFFSRFPSKSN